MLKQRNGQLFVKRVSPNLRSYQIKGESKWTPIIYDYYSFDSSNSKSLLKSLKQSKDPVITYLGYTKSTLKTLITIICIICCCYQIYSLAYEYFKYEVIESVSRANLDELSPPSISFCLNTIGSLNFTELFIRRPDVRSAASLVLESCFQSSKNKKIKTCHLTEIESVLLDFTQGPKIVFSRMRADEIYQLLPKLSSIMLSCTYLSTNLTSIECDETYFRTFMYAQKYCFEFLWYSRLADNQKTPVFQSNLINLPGFTNELLLNVKFNLTSFKSKTLLDVLIHRPSDIPWDIGKSRKEFQVPDNLFIFQDLTYSKTIRRSLPAPFQSNCVDFSKSPWTSKQKCLKNCSMDKFIQISGYYPRYYTVSNFDDHYLSHSYSARENYQPLIQQLSEKCLEICGETECEEVYYEAISLNSGRQLIPGSKIMRFSIYPPSQPVNLIRTTPVHAVEYFYANIGGTIGAWFGYSFLHTFTLVYAFSLKIYDRMKARWLLKHNQVQSLFTPTITKYNSRPIVKPLKPNH